MKIRNRVEPKATISWSDLKVGEVYRYAAGKSETNLYMKTDVGCVNLYTGCHFLEKGALLLERIDCELVIE